MVTTGGKEGARLNDEKLARYLASLEESDRLPPLGGDGSLDIKRLAAESGIPRSAFYTRGGQLRRSLEEWWQSRQGLPASVAEELGRIDESGPPSAAAEVFALRSELNDLKSKYLLERTRADELSRQVSKLKIDLERGGELTKLLLEQGRVRE